MNTDTLALLVHFSFEISQRRRESNRPHLNKDYAALCSSTIAMPVTNFLFGDELQARLSHIRASNKIGNTTSTTNTHKRGYNQGGHDFKNSKPFLGRAPYPAVAQLTEQSCEKHVQQFEHSHKELESISAREIDTSIISKLQSLEESEYQSILPSLVAFFRCRVSTSQAGQISHCVQQWRTLTSDSEVRATY